MSDRDNVIAKAILINMSEEQKQHYYDIIVSHDKGVRLYREGTLMVFPSIEIRFIQVGQVVLEKLQQPGKGC